MAFSIRVQSTGWLGLRRGALLLAGAASLAGCSDGHRLDCLKSTGSITTQRRTVDRRTRSVEVYGNVDLTIVPDTATYAEVRAGEHVADGITLTSEGPQNLVIKNTNTCNWTRSYDTPFEVRLHIPHLTNIRQEGYGLVSTASRWTQDTLFVHLLGAGDVKLDVTSKYLWTDMYELGDMTLTGTATEFIPTVGGSGFLFAGGLTARNCYFETTRTSLGDAHLRATQALGGPHAGKGTLYYAGNPSVLAIKGSGKAVKE
jgi:hypothetical protein